MMNMCKSYKRTLAGKLHVLSFLSLSLSPCNTCCERASSSVLYGGHCARALDIGANKMSSQSSPDNDGLPGVCADSELIHRSDILCSSDFEGSAESGYIDDNSEKILPASSNGGHQILQSFQVYRTIHVRRRHRLRPSLRHQPRSVVLG